MIADSVVELFRRKDHIENFNKKALYVLVREMTGYNTQHITKVINILKKYYKDIKANKETNKNTLKRGLEQCDKNDLLMVIDKLIDKVGNTTNNNNTNNNDNNYSNNNNNNKY